MKTKQAEAMKHSAHYVSPETPQHVPVPVDTDHAELVEAHGATNPGVTKDQTVRKHEQPGVIEKGAPDNRKTVTSKVAERHVKSEDGLKTAARRSAFLKQTKKENEKVFDKN